MRKNRNSLESNYQAAKRAHYNAQERCPHWDMCDEPQYGRPCCDEYHSTHEQLRKAREALRKSQL